MSILRVGRFRIAISALIAIFVIGTVGYWLIEGWSLLDSLYMTAITISTVGYDEVEPLSRGGVIFSIVLIIFGVGVMFYTVTMIFQYVAEGQFGTTLWRRSMNERIEGLKDHYIVCGYGRVGREVTLHIKENQVPFVVIEKDQASVDAAIEEDCLCIRGDVTSDEVLKRAGIEKARALIASVGQDVDNVYVTLSARGFRSDIFIAARASNDDSERKLKRAGANRVIFPERLGGRRMAMTALRPWVVDFIDTTVYSHHKEFSLEAIRIREDSPLVGLTVREGQQTSGGAVILALKKKDGLLIPHPPMTMSLDRDDEVVVIGTAEQLKALEGPVV